MNIADFEASLSRDGYQAVNRELPPDTINEPHSHPWDVRALVTAGEITLTVDGADRTYKLGDVFTMSAGCVHKEVIGGAGVNYIAGRRDIKAA